MLPPPLPARIKAGRSGGMQAAEAPWRPWLEDSKCPQVPFHNQEEPGSHGISEPAQLSTAFRKQVSRHVPPGSGVGSLPVGRRGDRGQSLRLPRARYPRATAGAQTHLRGRAGAGRGSRGARHVRGRWGSAGRAGEPMRRVRDRSGPGGARQGKSLTPGPGLRWQVRAE